MAPAEYFIGLQRGTCTACTALSSTYCSRACVILNSIRFLYAGIKGGFAPPTPNQVIQVTRSKELPHIVVAVQNREGAGLTGTAPKELAVTAAESLVDELISILKVGFALGFVLPMAESIIPRSGTPH